MQRVSNQIEPAQKRSVTLNLILLRSYLGGRTLPDYLVASEPKLTLDELKSLSTEQQVATLALAREVVERLDAEAARHRAGVSPESRMASSLRAFIEGAAR